MANRLTINYEKKPCYDIVFAHDFSGLVEELQDLQIKEKKVAVIADTNTAALFGEEVKELLAGNCRKVILHCASRVVGICTKSMPRRYVAAVYPVISPTTPPPKASKRSFLSYFSAIRTL